MKNQYVSDHVSLVNEWHPTRNGNLSPSQLKLYSHKKVWWKCAEGHEWQAAVKNRTQGDKCPYCSGKKAIPGETDLLTVNPELALDWHPLKNKELTPANLSAFSNKKVYWCCEKGHEWVASISNRSIKGSGCPYCSGRMPIPGKNDLASVNKKLTKEWNYDKNNGLTPDMFLPGSTRKVWWKCEKGHEWQATILSRSKGTDCPYCSGRFPIAGESDFATKQPVLSREWNSEKNGSLTPEKVTEFSNKVVWWKCQKCGHEWRAQVGSRSRGRGCPKCKK